MNSTKTILIGKKKKNNFKKNNIDDFLNDFIPRFTDEDIPESDLLIDNSFELKQYTSKKDTLSEKEIKKTSIVEEKKEHIQLKPIVEEKKEQEHIQLKPIVEEKKEQEHIQLKPIVENTLSPTKQSTNNAQLQIHPKTNKNIVSYIDTTINTHTTNFENIVYNYNKQKNTSKSFDTISTHSSIIDIMSLTDMNMDQLSKIKKNITNNNKKKNVYTPSYTNTLIQSKKIKKQSNKHIFSKVKDYKNHNHYNHFYNKYYTSIKNKEMIYNKNEQKKLNNSIKKIKVNDITAIRQILFTHKIISKKDIYMPDAMILDLYAMLSDKNCKFNIKQFT